MNQIPNQQTANRSRIRFASSFDDLCDHLLKDIFQNLPEHPLEPIRIVTPWHGIDHAISLKISEQHSVCANFRFFQPRDFIRELLGGNSGTGNSDNTGTAFPYDMSWLRWRLFTIIRWLRQEKSIEDGWHESFVLLFKKNQLRDDYQLACRLAVVYDNYLAFHPDLLARWLKQKKGRGRESHDSPSTDPANSTEPADPANSTAAISAGTLAHAYADDSWLAGIFKLLAAKEAVFRLLDEFTMMGEQSPLQNSEEPAAAEAGGEAPKTTETTETTATTATNQIATGNWKNPVYFLNVHWFHHLHLKILNQCQSQLSIFRYFLMSHPLQLLEESATKKNLPTFIQENERIVTRSLQRMHCLPESPEPFVSETETSNPLAHLIPSPKQMMIRKMTTRWMEIHNLYHFIFQAIDKNPNLTLNDFIIYVNDLQSYTAFFSAIFDHPVQPLQHVIIQEVLMPADRAAIAILWEFLSKPFTLDKLQIFLQSPEISGLLYFSESSSSKPQNQNQNQTQSQNQWTALIAWLHQCGFRYGLDGEYGLVAALQRLALSVAMDHKNNTGSLQLEDALVAPCLTIHSGDLEAVEECTEFLEVAILFAREIAQQKSLREWIAFAKKVLRQCLPGLAGSTIEDVFQNADQFERTRIFSETIDHETFFAAFIETNLQGSKVHGSKYFSRGVTILPLQPFHFVSKKVACMIGVNADLFPRSDARFDFDVAEISEFQSLRTKDRLLFSNIFSNTQDIFYLSYHHHQQQQQQPPQQQPPQQQQQQDEGEQHALSQRVDLTNMSSLLSHLSGATHLIQDLVVSLVAPEFRKIWSHQTEIDVTFCPIDRFSSIYFQGDSLQNFRGSDYSVACQLSGLNMTIQDCQGPSEPIRAHQTLQTIIDLDVISPTIYRVYRVYRVSTV